MFSVKDSGFYAKLTGRDKENQNLGYHYDQVKLKLKDKNNIFLNCDMVLIPIHLTNHWCMGALNFSKKRIE